MTAPISRLASSGETMVPLTSFAKATSPVLVDLEGYALLEASGAEAEKFLQNLTTNDVSTLGNNGVQWSGLCSIKGRLYATFLLWRASSECFFMLLPKEIIEDVHNRLSKFILRAKVKLTRADINLMGLVGVEISSLLQSLALPNPQPMAWVQHEQTTLVGLQNERVILMAPTSIYSSLQEKFSHCPILPSTLWDWMDIQARWPFINKETQDAYIPQMLDFDTLGVSFTKGCYPGQEVVARTHYLGKVKRNLFTGHVTELPDESSVKQHFAELFSADGKNAGKIVSLAPSPFDGWDFLAVMSQGIPGPFHLGKSDGPVVKHLPTP